MPVSRGRPYNTSTPLGQRMDALGLSLNRVAAQTGISHRKLSDYLANRRPIMLPHLEVLCEYLDVDPDDLTPSTPPKIIPLPVGRPRKVQVSR